MAIYLWPSTCRRWNSATRHDNTRPMKCHPFMGFSYFITRLKALLLWIYRCSKRNKPINIDFQIKCGRQNCAFEVLRTIKKWVVLFFQWKIMKTISLPREGWHKYLIPIEEFAIDMHLLLMGGKHYQQLASSVARAIPFLIIICSCRPSYPPHSSVLNKFSILRWPMSGHVL